MTKQRLETLVVSRKLAPDKKQAQRLILAGKISTTGGHLLTKPGQDLDTDTPLTLKKPPPFVSRGGEKLIASMQEWPINLKDQTCIDIGASTGGFTDCMLQHGAKKVYAVDVGRGLLNYKLQQDPRVTILDKTNARHILPNAFDPRPSFASFDVSFISLTKVMPPVLAAMTDNATLVTLIKPQFEAKREHVGKGGVVRDPEIHETICDAIKHFATETLQLEYLGRIKSPITGPAGNIEFLAYWKKTI